MIQDGASQFSPSELERMRRIRSQAEQCPQVIIGGSTGAAAYVDDDGVGHEAFMFILSCPQEDFPNKEQGVIYLFSPEALGRMIEDLILLANKHGGAYRTEARKHIRQALRESNLGI